MHMNRDKMQYNDILYDKMKSSNNKIIKKLEKKSCDDYL